MERHEIYKCSGCGVVVEVLEGGDCKPCCGDSDMVLQEPQTADRSKEKHVPFIEKIDGGYRVKVGENAAHPMEEDHYIQWIELQCGGMVSKVYLKPGDAPEAVFCVGACKDTCDQPTAREHCNKHGLWKG